jgi:hypothetical protein
MRTLLIATLVFSATNAQAQTPTRSDACGARKVQDMVGKKASKAIVAAIGNASGAESVRVIKPGQPVTMDYRETRLNASLDKKGRIREFGCG